MSTIQSLELQRASRMVNRSKKLVDTTPYSEKFAPMYSYLQTVHDNAQSAQPKPASSRFSVDEVVRSGESVLDDVKSKVPSKEGFAEAAKVWGVMVESAVELDRAVKMEQPKNFLDNQLTVRSELNDSINQLNDKIAQDQARGDNALVQKDQTELSAQQSRVKALDEEVVAIARMNKDKISAEDIDYYAAEYNLPADMIQQMKADPTLRDQAIMDKVHTEQKKHVVQDSLDVTQKSLAAVGETLMMAGVANPEVAVIGGIIEGISAVVGAIKSALAKKEMPDKQDELKAEQEQNNDNKAQTEAKSQFDPQRSNWAQQMKRPEPTPKASKSKDELDNNMDVRQSSNQQIDSRPQSSPAMSMQM